MRRVLRKVVGLTQPLNLISRSVLSLILVGLLTLVLLTAWVPTATGSLPILRSWQQHLQQPSQVQRLGNVEVAPVRLDGEKLFTLATPTVWDRAQPHNQLPIEDRVKQVEANLNQVIAGGFLHDSQNGILTNFDPKTLQVSIVSLNDVPVITAGDNYHSQPLKLVTVTYIDADYNGQPIQALSEQWRSIVYQHLYAALMERSPDALTLGGKLGESLLALAMTLGASLVLALLQIPLQRSNRRLRLQQAALTSEIPDPSTDAASVEQQWMQMRLRFLASWQQQRKLQQQRDVIGWFRWLLAWGQVAVWVTGVMIALIVFPWTRSMAEGGLMLPAGLLALWFLTACISRLVSLLLHLLAAGWVKFGRSTANDPQRDKLRIFTILQAVKPLKTAVVYLTGLIVALLYLGLPLSLVITAGSIIAFAVLLICQDVVREALLGCFILWEGQYVIGDVITIGHHAGLVETMNLRLTQLRGLKGQLISLVNGALPQVENLTCGWIQQHRRAERASSSLRLNQKPEANSLNRLEPFAGDSNEPTLPKS